MQDVVQDVRGPLDTMPGPSTEMLASPEFEAVWQVIKSWDINVPSAYQGYMGATGSHVRAILDALAKVER